MIPGTFCRTVPARRVVGVTLLMCLAGLTAASAQDAPPLPRVGFDDDGQGEALARELSGPDLKTVPLAVRLEVRAGDAAALAAVQARVALLARAGLQVWLRLADVPSAADEVSARPWRAFVRTLMESTRGHVRLVELPLASTSRLESSVRLAFLLKVAAVQVRAVDPTVLIAVHGERLADSEWIEAFYAADVAAYVDVLSLPAPADGSKIDALGRTLARVDPDARVVITGEPLSDVAQDARGTVVRTQLGRLGGVAACTPYSGSPIARAAEPCSPARPWLESSGATFSPARS